MDDYSLTALQESKNEWCMQLLNKITPEIIIGINSIFDDACKICRENEEEEKYLMTFQNLLGDIPKWTSAIIDSEVSRIKENTRCGYLDELISAVYIIHLKSLSYVKVGNETKKIDIDIPKLGEFIHNVYIRLARKVYKNVYLYDVRVHSLDKQKNRRELELLAREAILQTIQESIPVEDILKAYLDKTSEESCEVTEHEEIIGESPILEDRAESSQQGGGFSMNSNDTPHDDENIRDLPVENTPLPQIDTSSENGVKFAGSQEMKEFDASNTITDISNTPSIQGPLNNKPHSSMFPDYDDDDEEEDVLKIGDSIDLGGVEKLVPSIQSTTPSKSDDIDLGDIQILS